MNKISDAFLNKKAMIGFLTAGDPSLAKTDEYILTMVKAGIDLIEIGIPFSDPIAEGDIIQKANKRALDAGTTTDRIFGMVKSVRMKTDIPLIFLTYMNPVFVFGTDRFFTACADAGINGIIIPDLPFEERGEISDAANRNNVEIITLIAPTSSRRIEKLAVNARGFIYLVSSLGVTGIRDTIDTDIKPIIDRIRKVTDTAIAIGFGISSPSQAKAFLGIADGVIVGSAIVKIIEEYGNDASQPLYEYIDSMKKCFES
ncbi:MAG: tryptophan synthase subunit alpha [Saccharofermentanales bacterium]